MGVQKIVIFGMVLLVFACGSEPAFVVRPVTEKNTTEKQLTFEVPDFNADSALYYVQKQVDFGPRVPNSLAHQNCAKWLIDYFKNLGFEVREQRGEQKAHDGKILNFVNIIAKYQAGKKNRILLSAHWDTRPWADEDLERTEQPIDGANDGASGVGVLLELARILAMDTLGIGVDFVLFDIEDYGVANIENSFCYGAQYWYQNFDANEIIPKYGINLDMVGDANAQFFYEGFSFDYARPILDKVWKVAHHLGYEDYFIAQKVGYITDDHLWVNKAGIPCIDIIHRDAHTGSFPQSWHTHQDHIGNIDKKTLAMVGEVVLFTIYQENQRAIN